MSKLLNIKEWAETNRAQFEPTLYYPGEKTGIANVIRTKDGLEFKLGQFYVLKNPNSNIYRYATFRILRFDLDLIHVEYELMCVDLEDDCDMSGFSNVCEINDIIYDLNMQVTLIRGFDIIDELG